MALMLSLAGELQVFHGEQQRQARCNPSTTVSQIVVDGWARFNAAGKVAVLVSQLRAAVADLLAAKLEDPGLPLVGHRCVDALHALLVKDGF